MTFDVLVPYRHLIIIFQNLKGWLDIFEYLIYGISTQSISILLIKFVVLVDSFRHLDAALLGALPVPGLNFGYTLITPSERVWRPP